MNLLRNVRPRKFSRRPGMAPAGRLEGAEGRTSSSQATLHIVRKLCEAVRQACVEVALDDDSLIGPWRDGTHGDGTAEISAVAASPRGTSARGRPLPPHPDQPTDQEPRNDEQCDCQPRVPGIRLSRRITAGQVEEGGVAHCIQLRYEISLPIGRDYGPSIDDEVSDASAQLAPTIRLRHVASAPSSMTTSRHRTKRGTP